MKRMILAAGLGVDLGDLEAVAVAGPLVGEREQVGALLDGDRLLLRARPAVCTWMRSLALMPFL